MLRKTFLTVAVAGVALAGTAAAQTGASELLPAPDIPTTRSGTRGANFLEIGAGARAQAMGNALTGLASGVTAMYWNPAGISSTEGISAAFSRSNLYQDLDIAHTYAGVLVPMFGGALGINYTRLDSGDIPRTDETHPDRPDQQFGSNFTFEGTAVGLAYGRRLTDRLAIGVGAKVVSEGIQGASAQWWAMDVGTQFNTGLYGLKIGAALTNIGSQSRWNGPLVERFIQVADAFPVSLPVQFATVKHALPTAFHFSVVSNLAGASDALLAPNTSHSLQAVLELNDGVDTDLMTTIAGEYSYRNIVFLRAGKRWVNEQQAGFRSGSYGLAWGGGLKIPVFGRHLIFDYAYTNMGELQNVQTFSFEIGN